MVPVIMMKEIDEDEGTFDFQVAPVLSPADLLLSISDLWSLLLSISVDSFFSLDFPLVLAKLPDFLFTSFSLFPSFLLTSSSFLRLSGFASVWSLWLFVSRSWDILPAGRTWKWNSFWDGNNFSSKTQIWSQHWKKYGEQKSWEETSFLPDSDRQCPLPRRSNCSSCLTVDTWDWEVHKMFRACKIF